MLNIHVQKRDGNDGMKEGPAYDMHSQAIGDVDFITGDYLAGMLAV